MKLKLPESFLKNRGLRPGRNLGSGVLGFMNPERDWLIGLSVVATIFVVGVTYIAYDFYRQFGAPDQVVIVEESPVVYQDKEVIRFAELYEKREETFNTLKNTFIPPLPAAELPLADE